MSNENPNGENQAENVENLTAAFQETLLHIDLNKTLYTISPPELKLLEEGSSNIWKDIMLASVSIALPCLLNALNAYNKLNTEVFTAEIFLNTLMGTIGVIFAIISAVIWRKGKSECRKLIEELKKRPKYKV